MGVLSPLLANLYMHRFIKMWFAAIGLEINESKTSVRHARQESFDFLGYTFKVQRSFKNGKLYYGALPSVKAVKRLERSIRHQLHRANMNPIELVVERLNRTLRGWANYFRYGTVMRVRQKLDHFTCDRVRYFLARRTKCPTRGTHRYGWDYVFGESGVVSLNRLPRVAT
jgi:RNA-directed DNA polymerase